MKSYEKRSNTKPPYIIAWENSSKNKKKLSRKKCSLSGFTYSSYKFLTNFFEYPVVVNLEVENEGELFFPAVTICNSNRMRVSELHKDVCKSKRKSCEYLRIIHESSSDIENKPEFVFKFATCSNSSKREMTLYHQKLLAFTNTFSRFEDWKIKKMSHQIEDMIEECTFDGEKCDASSFTPLESFTYGSCYTFNGRWMNSRGQEDMGRRKRKKFIDDGNEKLISRSTNPFSGLSLTLNVQIEEYLSITSKMGVHVIIHSPDERPYPEETGIDISTGFDTAFAIQENLYRRMSKPFKDKCVLYGKDDFKKIKSQKECLSLCTRDLIKKECGCLDPTLKFYRNVTFCDLTKEEDACCMMKMRKVNISYCQCPLPCHEITYDVSLYSTIWPSESEFKLRSLKNLSKQITYEEYRKGHLQMNVFFDRMERFIYNQHPVYEKDEFFSHLGGQLSLWLGLSLLTLFEYLEKFSLFCIQVYKNFSRK
ncbi:acid-sensing ion channel 4-like [Centruroides sculpturatus]|uniref:acid-sensing ion channel 4-like n=2 Tax=Centruroides sculpturatus TaxID=218467 RepID=UPI000C6E03BE|nr:acid-sensing ion channel 4-like [Centruroides sculpturatus]